MCWGTNKNRAQRAGRAGGFTLLEIIVCLVLLGMISVGVFSVLGYTARITESAKQLALQLPQVDAALAVLHHALASSPTPVSPTSNGCSYTRPDYSQESMQLDGTKLYIVHGGEKTLLLDQVQSFNVTTDKGNYPLFTLSIQVLLPGEERTFTKHITSHRRVGHEPEKGTLL
jgi:prepilin-type N-terminal cleavage/methylation domain-containing protein